MAATSALDAFQLARRQLEVDRQRMQAFPWLAGRKRKLMQASALGFLRGSARLFYEILQDNPSLAQGPGGEGFISGDLHLENFGAYRADNLLDSNVPKAVFNLNDFDEAVVGPWRYDVLRFLTSFLLAAQGLFPPEPRKVSASEQIIEAYVAAAMQSGTFPRPPEAVRKLMERVRNRTRKELLDARTRLVGGKRRLIRGKRYRSLGKELAAKARRAFSEYAKRLPERAAKPDALEILDLAFRIAGTGSLGLLRVAVLVKGKGGPNGAWLFDMKEEERSPAPSLLVGTPQIEPAERVVRAFRACLEVPPQRMGTTRIDDRSMFVRRLTPQEDRVSTRGMDFDELSGLASFFGALSGAAHRRGSRDRPRPWSPGGREQLLGSALALAGIYQATYSAFCHLCATGRGDAHASTARTRQVTRR